MLKLSWRKPEPKELCEALSIFAQVLSGNGAIAQVDRVNGKPTIIFQMEGSDTLCRFELTEVYDEGPV